jgi:hypothetical protein
MLTSNVILEVKKENRIYTLTLPNNASLGELHDVLYEMRYFVAEKINAAVEADKSKTPNSEVKSE